MPNGTGRPKRPPRWQRAFLAALAESGNVTAACRAARVARSVVYERLDADPDLGELWDAALDEAADRLETEALRRAVDGVSRPVTHKGELVYVPVDPAVPDGDKVPLVEVTYSDTLLIFLLKAARPEKYRERWDVQHAGEVRNPTIDAALTRMLADPEALAAAEALADAILDVPSAEVRPPAELDAGP